MFCSKNLILNLPKSRSFLQKLCRNIHCNTPKCYRFVQYITKNNAPSLGIQLKTNSEIVDLTSADSSIPNSLVEYLQKQDSLNLKLPKILNEKKQVYNLEEIRLIAPITKPDKVICVGLNYKGHCDEQNKPYPEQPFFFSKFSSTIIGPNDSLTHPPNTKALDWEVELAVVIGKKTRLIKQEDAYDYIFGYTAAQDISARDWQTPKKNNGQYLVAKSMDQFCPLGPCVVTKDEIPDPHNLQISCSINGIQKQNANTEELIHRIDKLVSYLSGLFTLLPGDIILTGTPGGVGVFRNPREFLRPGDKIQSEISTIGSLENNVE